MVTIAMKNGRIIILIKLVKIYPIILKRSVSCFRVFKKNKRINSIYKRITIAYEIYIKFLL